MDSLEHRLDRRLLVALLAVLVVGAFVLAATVAASREPVLDPGPSRLRTAGAPPPGE